jgi:hypothetical protein
MRRGGASPQDAISAVRQVYAADPGLCAYYAILVDHAKESGGLCLKFWQTYLGAVFADPSIEPSVRSIEETAAILRAPLSQLIRIHRDSTALVKARWQATPEYQQAGCDCT